MGGHRNHPLVAPVASTHIDLTGAVRARLQARCEMNHDETGGRAGAPRDARSALGRRGLLQSAWAGATLAAAGAALGSAGCAEEGEPSGGARSDIEGAVKRIDTHHHVLPPKVKEW